MRLVLLIVLILLCWIVPNIPSNVAGYYPSALGPRFSAV